MKFMKIRFCSHEFGEPVLIRDYYDYSGVHVGVFEFECIKCGKTMEKKMILRWR